MLDSLQSLLEQTGPRLQLRWLNGEPEQGSPLRRPERARSRESLIGSLNCIHPNCLQVIGRAEQRYLQALGRTAFEETLEQLFAEQPAAILFADGLEPHPAFFAFAAEHDTPLLGSPLGDEELINHLRYFLTHALAERQTLHGVFIEVLGMGVLLVGDPAVGKSELALDLITRGHRLIADDAPRFARIAPEAIEGTCPETLRDFLEVRGLGILNIRAMFGEGAVQRSKTLNLIIDLQPLDQQQIAGLDRLTGSLSATDVLGVAIPTITMPVAPGRNLAILVEAAVRHQILRIRGYDAGVDFIDRQARAIRLDRPDPPGPGSRP
ncbi:MULTISPECIES: HPr(Ser) kinase/phosphatase [Marichromatium]|uniref:HPr kinase/phosphorylase n=1 Tax=Marichromatium gracile TaxID=1048 RepID=A0A4R4ADC1_MARGR|nr:MULTISPECIES: HPr(Ser) kinase/phosphatase [Marichromatium]MBO8084509.1 HPr(Ser) kinase/phosphatase [Marichromatium sp.]MBK1708998.1 HPr(Ser) kinase/phosphatase [Marichromatium gracile]RNE91649.1 HPr(Ser) kinase/phosphatase [Marichromatium sp. AB31]RNE93406.1 HPr(Ser) kinase/phosphatase [Marichromatium sp. AB32]TCW36874.1 Hpr(Ser) kinase/phosphatase [Marichromatium gracile]